jgi:superfamily II DNA or RNA helicase
MQKQYSPDRLIGSCSSWSDFWLTVASLSEKQKGDVFERLVQLYLLTKPKYKTELAHVWLRLEVPPDIRRKLNLPTTDEGIDLVVQTRDEKFWAIQAKFKSDPEKAPTYKELSTFTNLAFVNCKHVDLALVAHTSTRPVRKRDLLGNLTELGLAEWLSTTEEDWTLIHQQLRGKAPRPQPRTPRLHQTQAIAAASKHYIDGNARRGRLIMPCGTGKSLTAFWIAEALKAQTISVIVPSLALIKQGIEDWTREFVALDENPLPEWLCVCSDESAGALDKDEFVGEVYDLGIPTTTNPHDIGEFLKRETFARRVVFVTYQSSERLAEAAQQCGFIFDFAVLDEAHKTVGVKDKAFAVPLFDENLPVSKRLFMTATERVVRGRNDDVVSMNDETVYGPCFHELSFKDAIHAEPPIISDYKILTYAVTDEEVLEFIRDNRLLTDSDADVEEQEASFVAASVALRHAFQNYGIKHALSFHRSIRSASRFADQQQGLSDAGIFEQPVDSLHISSNKSAGERARLLFEFEQSPRALMTNARCLTEGVDVPAIDCVLFADPKQSRTDIVQATGRALRPYEGKSFGYIMLPIIVPSGMSLDEFAETTEFRHVASVITALSTQDGRIAEEFRLEQFGRVPSGKIVEIEGSVPLGAKIDIHEFSQAIETKLWESVGRANWRSFQEARAFVHALGFETSYDWKRYVRSGNCPPDIPRSPHYVYASDSWRGWKDWLGAGRTPPIKEARPFIEARAFARRLRLANFAEWKHFAKSSQRPNDIPTQPWKRYASTGWAGIDDWLGTRRRPPIQKKRPFTSARKFARSLGIKSRKEWNEYAASGRLPKDIPSDPAHAYRGQGWSNLADWLGVGERYLPFKEARSFVRRLKLRSAAEWRTYSGSGKRPANIPSAPYRAYEHDGWKNWADWLGTEITKRSFVEARAYARSLNLGSIGEWRAYTKSGKLPADIPARPENAFVYGKEGWVSYADWLGKENQKRSFSDARVFVRLLNLKTVLEWREYTQSKQYPADIPKNPDTAYAAEWVDWGDWLGTGRTRPWRRNKRPYTQARTFVRRLGLKSTRDWDKYAASGRRPLDIPFSPNIAYASEGWVDWADWLGLERKQYRSFSASRSFVRGLRLSTQREWQAYCQSGKLPSDIPADPRRVYAKAGWSGMVDWLGTSPSGKR